MKFSAAQKYLDALDFRGVNLGLHRTRKLLAALGDPQKKLRVIHVAGTNGKGSVATMVARILDTATIPTGLYTSPHFESFRERIVIGGAPITRKRVAALIDETAQVAERSKLAVTYFEFLTVVAFLAFARANVRVAVVEVGLGGRFDSTNVITPFLSIITSVGLDHQAQLGGRLAEVAFEKCGVIKKGRPVISGVRSGPAAKIIHRETHKKEAPLLRLGSTFITRRKRPDGWGEHFSYNGKKYRLALSGKIQVANAALALRSVELLRQSGYHIPETAVADALASLTIPGRFEILGGRIILDGAHNSAAVRSLALTLKERYGPKVVDLVFGAMADKNIGAMLKTLAPFARSITFYAPAVPRAATAAEQRRALGHCDLPLRKVQSVDDVLKLGARATSQRPLLVTGSFYTLGELRTPLMRMVADGENG